jgi:hypothetical protein
MDSISNPSTVYDEDRLRKIIAEEVDRYFKQVVDSNLISQKVLEDLQQHTRPGGMLHR